MVATEVSLRGSKPGLVMNLLYKMGEKVNFWVYAGQ